MTPAIRIIRSQSTPAATMFATEREKQINAVAERVADASGYITPERVDACAEKLRHIANKFLSKTPEQLALSISRRMSSPDGASGLMAHADLDYDRIMQLLEG